MSKDMIVLAPNGRRQKIHCNPDTSILQILEDACRKQGFQPSDYDLKHHNHILDLTTTIRFSNLPNKATLEMVEAEQKRKESTVTIGLQLEDGERRTADFLPTTTLFDLVTSLAPTEIDTIQQPTILYMRQEVVGEFALKEKTLRQLGLIKGRAILRLLDKPEEARQANVSSVYRRPISETKITDTVTPKSEAKDHPQASTDHPHISTDHPHTSTDHPHLSTDCPQTSTKIDEIKKNKYHQPDILTKLKADIQKELKKNETPMEQEQTLIEPTEKVVYKPKKEEPMVLDVESSASSSSMQTQESLERRLKIEEEVTFLGDYKAIAFMQPDSIERELDDLPDDFYDLSVEEVRKLYHELQQSRMTLENAPLLLASQKQDSEMETSQQKLNLYKNVVVRIQFPDQIILQGIFLPTNTIEDVTNFIKEHLQYPNEKFHIFTTPLKETLDPKMTLLEAKFVPCVHMHFKWLRQEIANQPYLKEDIYSRTTAPDAASMLASKYRAPSRRRQDGSTHTQKSNKPSTSKSGNSKVPRWFIN